MADTETFYDQLAENYRLIYPDWEASLARQAKALDRVIQEHFSPDATKILDAACGIGTQCIGLAALGYRLSATDISERELNQAAQEARARTLEIQFKRSDMRTVADAFAEKFDLVIACDNAIPHLLTDEDILQAFRSFYTATGENGGVIISVRDYAAIETQGTTINPRGVRTVEGRRTILFDTWDFDGQHYDVTIYLLEDRGGSNLSVKVVRGGRYYCVSIQKLEILFKDAGFEEVATLREHFFQPLIVARKKAAQYP